MKRLFLFTMMVAMLGQTFVRTAWTLHYQWNRAQYLSQCENRDKPQLECAGQCNLKKEIAASESNGSHDEKGPQLPGGFHLLKDALLYFQYENSLPAFFGNIQASISLPPYAVFLPAAPGQRIFKPPSI